MWGLKLMTPYFRYLHATRIVDILIFRIYRYLSQSSIFSFQGVSFGEHHIIPYRCPTDSTYPCCGNKIRVLSNVQILVSTTDGFKICSSLGIQIFMLICCGLKCSCSLFFGRNKPLN